MATTYNNLCLDLRRQLKAAGVLQAQLEARELVAFAAGKTRQELLRDLSLYVPRQVEERLAELTERRLAGEPVAYLIGEWEFFGLTLDITPQVLIPRTDTEVLAERAIAFVRSLVGARRVLDLCAGSGCVGLAIAAHCPQAQVVLGDISEDALEVCRRNIRRCGLGDRVNAMLVNARQAPTSVLWDFDLIVCNPPYIPTGDLAGLDPSVRDYEPALALDGGADGLDFYRVLAEKWGRALTPQGRLMVEVGMGQSEDVELLLAHSGFTHLESTRDTGGIWRVVEGTAPPG